MRKGTASTRAGANLCLGTGGTRTSQMEPVSASLNCIAGSDELTDWFPASIKPHWPGKYEVKFEEDSPIRMRYWDGDCWCVFDDGLFHSVFGFFGGQWRGIFSPHVATVLEAADACMSPEQRDLFDKIGERDPDVYSRLFAGIVAKYLAQGAE